MIRIKKNNIYHMRGDTGCIGLNFYDNTQEQDYSMQDGDYVIFTVKKNTKTNEILYQKIGTKNQLIFHHGDTNDLPAGRYVYDIQLVTPIGIVQTIGPYKYILEEDVTRL